jgi:hypothetical protein
MIELIRRWYEGVFVAPDNPPDSPVIIVMGRYRRHWTSNAAHYAVDFYLREWKWLLPFLVALVGVVVAIAKL